MSREPLLAANRDLNDRGVDCAACSGECCTSRSNSMQITREEAADIRAYLEAHGLWDASLLTRLHENIREYRLDVELPSFGRRQNLRRTYTCPFYSAGPRGCSLPREVKPYGCLAFNPTQTGARGLADGCASDQQRLAECITTGPEAEKWPIPVALINLL